MNEHVDPRAFTYAVGASIALHAALLALRAPETQLPVIPRAAPIVAHLVEPEAAPPAPPVVEQPAPPPPAKREIAKPAPKPVQPAPQPQTFSVVPAPAEPPAPAAEPAPAPAPAPSVPSAVASAPPATPAPPAPDPAMLIAQYRHQLIGAAVRFKRYPLAARDNGWEGEVRVEIDIGPSGELAAVRVKRRSAYRLLDDQALETFRLAVPEVPAPSALRGRSFSIEIPVRYSLTD